MDSQQLSERQQQIVDAALRIVASKGCRRLTAETLATEVGITGGALYRHFTGLDQLVEVMVDRIATILFEGFPPQASDPIERLRLFLVQRVATVRANPHLARLLFFEHLAQNCGAASSKRMEALKQRLRAFVVECLQEASDAGMLAAGMSVESCALVVLGSVQALSHSAKLATQGSEGDRLLEEVWLGIERMLRRATTSDSRARQARRKS
jgi:AcrR family transcriptional regulator